MFQLFVRLTFFISFFLILAGKIYGQFYNDDTTSGKQAILTEIAGNSRSILSVNYERIFPLKNKNYILTIRTGVGFVPGSEDNSTQPTVSVPLVFSFLAGPKKSFLHVSMGYTASFSQNSIDSSTTPPTHHQKYESAFLLRTEYRFMERNGILIEGAPMLQWTDNPDSRFSIFFGFAIGCTF